MPYINSNSINVFPCANRGTAYNLQSRLTSEYNLTNIINQLIDTDSFVITNVLTTDGPLAFNIHGYYFNVSNYQDITNLDSSWTDVYAQITIAHNELEGGLVFHELTVNGTEDVSTNLDGDTTFDGVEFTGTKPTEAQDHYYLHILHRNSTSSDWYIPPESTVKFLTNSKRRSIKIDDGEL